MPGTGRLTLPQDDAVVHARHMQQVEDYFQRRIEEAWGLRDRQWKPDFSSAKAYEDSIASHRANCRTMLGLVDANADVARAESTRLAASGDLRMERVTIPMFAGLSARGLLFSPLANGPRVGGRRFHTMKTFSPRANGPRPAVIVCGDADTWPERFAGLTDDGKPAAWLTDLVARGAMVYLPQSIERLPDHPYSKTTNNKDRRMILYRLGYPVGRTMPGLDVQDTLAAIDYLVAREDVDPSWLGLVGIGQGGMTALYTAALDRRTAAVTVADYFQVRDHCWQEPVDRRLARQLLEFGDAELAGLVAPRPLRVVHSAASAIPKDRVMAEIARQSGVRASPVEIRLGGGVGPSLEKRPQSPSVPPHIVRQSRAFMLGGDASES